MEMLSSIKRLFQHDHWANRETLLALEKAGEVPRAYRLFAHIFAAEWLWLGRLKREPKKLAVWPDFAQMNGEAELEQLSRAWKDYLDALTPAALDHTVEYKNSKGEQWENTVGDILLHVTMHSSYHRGQVATLLRDAGAEPAYTDYIEAVRRANI